jgi:protein-S-isoprenylcysteine O-methyltransferase Ste14
LISVDDSAADDGDATGDTAAEPAAPPPARTATDTAYRGDVPKTPREPRKPPTIWQRATYRWTAITAVMAMLLVVYTQHPYYLGAQFAPFRSIYTPWFVLWLVLGIFYCKATLEKFKGMRYAMRDGGLHLLIVAKSFRIEPFTRAQKIGLRALALVLTIASALVIGGTPNRTSGITVGSLVLGTAVIVAIAKAIQPRRLWKLVTTPRIRTTLLSIVVKAFYMPLMIGFFSGHANSIAEAWLRHKHLPGLKFVVVSGYPWQMAGSWFAQMRARLPDLLPAGSDFSGLFAMSAWTRADISWGLGVAYDITFFIDCGWALMGYGLESRWLGNKTRSVEPTALGWAAALSCYPPYNNVLGTYLPLDNGKDWIGDDSVFPVLKQFLRDHVGQVLTGEDMHLILRGLIVVLFFVYATATVAFGFKFSNLTNRGTISRGPYRFIRHPAYVCKCTAWWLEHLPTLTLVKAFFLTLLCGVYALRAWTEERHLSRDPDYRAYKKKVPWVIFPGVY